MANKKYNMNGNSVADSLISSNEIQENETPASTETKKRGRKKTEKGTTAVVSFRIDKEIVEQLKGYAFYEDMTLKEALEMILTDFLKDKDIAKRKED